MDGRCLRVGVLTNPRSGGNKKGLKEIRNVLVSWPDVVHCEAFTPEGMTEALSCFASEGVELIVINGGDGTAHAVLTAIECTAIFAQPPLLAMLCAGTTSMLPRDVGIQGPSVVALMRVLHWAKHTDASLIIQPRPVLLVKRASGQPALCGMFFGVGAICQGIKAFHSGINPMGWRGQIMPGLTLLRMLLAILFKNQKRVPPLLTRSCLDGQQQEESANLFVLISTLERLFFGIRPYWGREDGPLHYTAVGAAPKYLLRIIPSLFSWQKNRYAKPDNGYFSHNVYELRLELEGDFTLDGELYAVGQGPLTIEAAGPIKFLCSP
ncbi:MAG: diacylglycerol kinase family protein [Desulfuromusa sp.]|nr:diacylglycerol kinase family protein [Desulfuromusa sp.]